MNLRILFYSLLLFFAFSAYMGCQPSSNLDKDTNENETGTLSDDSLMTLVQRQTFEYFWSGAEPNSGMARERYHVDDVYPENDKNIVTSGGTGFGIMAILVGIERGFVDRKEGVARLQKITDFLEGCERYHGAWSHWINGETGETKPFSKKDEGGDLVETAFLAQGLLCARQYLKDGNAEEQKLAEQLDNLWRGIEWNYYRGEDRENVLFWHWSPNYNWEMNHRVRGYNECMITYVLAASSPTHPIPPEVYHEGWAMNGDMVETDTTQALALIHRGNKPNGGPLFWSHYSYLGLNPKGLKDRYADYWELATTHTLLNYQHCVDNPNEYEDYGPNCWGLTASYSIDFYKSHTPQRDLGVISPTAALSSFPYTPEYSMNALRHFYTEHGDKIFGKYGFYDAFSVHHSWYPQKYLAIDQGPIVSMIENHRTGFLWDLFMSCEEVKNGLTALDFTF